jgi:hypothetical protein
MQQNPTLSKLFTTNPYNTFFPLTTNTPRAPTPPPRPLTYKTIPAHLTFPCFMASLSTSFLLILTKFIDKWGIPKKNNLFLCTWPQPYSHSKSLKDVYRFNPKNIFYECHLFLLTRYCKETTQARRKEILLSNYS